MIEVIYGNQMSEMRGGAGTARRGGWRMRVNERGIPENKVKIAMGDMTVENDADMNAVTVYQEVLKR